MVRLLPVLLLLITLIPVAVAQKQSADEVRAVAQKAFDAGDWKAVAKEYGRLVKLDPKDGMAWHHLGYGLHAEGRLDEAMTAHLKAMEFESVRQTATYNVACVHALKGNKDEAFKYLRQAIDFGFLRADHLDADSDMNSLRKDPRYAEAVDFINLKRSVLYGEPRAQGKESIDSVTVTPSNAKGSAKGSAGFDFILGEWSVTNTFSREGGGSMQTKGTLSAKKLMDGVIMERFSGEMYDGTHIVGITIRSFDPASNTWSIVWLDDRGSRTFSPYIGTFEDGKGVFELKKGDATQQLEWTVAEGEAPRWRHVNIKDGKAFSSWSMAFERKASGAK